MKKKKLTLLTLTLLISIFYCMAYAVERQYDSYCDVENQVFIGSLTIKEDLINQAKVWGRLNNRSISRAYLLITNEEEYKIYKTQHAEAVDFEQNSVFCAFFDSYGVCRIPNILPIKFSLLSNKWTSVVQTIYLPNLRVNCPPFFVTVIIPKRYSGKICYTQNFIERK